MLFGRDRLPGQQSLVNQEAAGVEKPEIGRDTVARFDENKVARDDVARQVFVVDDDVARLAVPADDPRASINEGI